MPFFDLKFLKGTDKMGLPNAVNKKRLQIAFALLLVFAMAAAITGCGGGKDLHPQSYVSAAIYIA